MIFVLLIYSSLQKRLYKSYYSIAHSLSKLLLSFFSSKFVMQLSLDTIRSHQNPLPGFASVADRASRSLIIIKYQSEIIVCNQRNSGNA